MKKNNFKSFVAGSIFTLVLSSTVVYGAGVTKTISANFGDVQLKVNNKAVAQETLLYNGTTYVPLRATGEILGLDVSYDSTTKTAYLNDKNNPYNAPSKVIEPTQTKTDTNAKVYKDGTYIVGTDLPAGLYKVTTTSDFGSYFSRLSGLDGELDSIISNGHFGIGGGYFEVSPSDKAIEISRCTISLIDDKTYNPTIKTSVSDGLFLVGKDIAPGTYKVTSNNGRSSYVARLSGLDGRLDSIIANDNHGEGGGYIEISPSDKAVDVTGTLTKQ